MPSSQKMTAKASRTSLRVSSGFQPATSSALATTPVPRLSSTRRVSRTRAIARTGGAMVSNG